MKLLPLPYETHLHFDGKRVHVGYTEKELDKVRRYLHLRAGRWANRRMVSWETGVTTRKVRRMGEYSGEIIFSQQGLKLASHATPEEIAHCVNDLQSRARHIRRHAKRIETLWGAS